MTSAVDPTLESVALVARLAAINVNELVYEGIPQDEELPVDGFGNRKPYRDIQPGSVIPAAGQRMVAVGEQGQPHIWAFQVTHFAKSRKTAWDMAVATDKSLIGWSPTANAGPITTFFFTTYDEFSKTGDRIGWLATRFYETTLGQTVDFTL